MRIGEVVRNAATNPVEAIQVIVAITVLVLAIYVISPIYVPSNAQSAVAIAFGASEIQKTIVGLLVLLPAMPTLLSLFVKKYNTHTWYIRSSQGMFVSLLFLTFLRIFVVGIFPATWITTLGLAFVMVPCYLYWKADKRA